MLKNIFLSIIVKHEYFKRASNRCKKENIIKHIDTRQAIYVIVCLSIQALR
jgi:hypothetical protein